MLEIQIVAFILLIGLSAFFSGAETALITLSDAKVKTLVRQRKRGADALKRIKENNQRLLVTILVCNDALNIASAAIATVVFIEIFGSLGVGIAMGLMTFLVLLFGDITPKTVATKHATRISLFVARPMEILCKVLFPVVFFFEFISRQITKLFGKSKEDALSEDEIKSIVTMGKNEGIITPKAAEMMHNLLRFKNIMASEIMTPKAEMEIIDGDRTLRDVIDFVVKCQYTRYPVYLRNESNIIGVLDENDVLKYAKNNKLSVKSKIVARPWNSYLQASTYMTCF